MRSKDNGAKRPISRTEKARLHRQLVEADDDELDDFDDETKSSDSIGADEIIRLLRHIEEYRQALVKASDQLKDWCRQSDEFNDAWQRFTAMGGVSGDDFSGFLYGRFRYRPTRRKRHLRLVITTKPKPKLQRSRGEGNDAA